MKFLITIIVFFAAVTFTNAQTKKENVKVYGNCSMCKSRIEKAAKSAGATTASWNEETKIMSIQFNSAKTTNKKIQEAVAAVGHDTQDCVAPNSVYNKLDECCLYDRKTKTN